MLAVELHTSLFCGDTTDSNAMQATVASDINNGKKRLIFMLEKIDCIADPENTIINDRI